MIFRDIRNFFLRICRPCLLYPINFLKRIKYKCFITLLPFIIWVTRDVKNRTSVTILFCFAYLGLQFFFSSVNASSPIFGNSFCLPCQVLFFLLSTALLNYEEFLVRVLKAITLEFFSFHAFLFNFIAGKNDFERNMISKE